MGGAGAIAFCGRKRYQLVGSRRFDGSGEFGFTLIRRHPLSTSERESKKNTWYEYLVIDERIPSFPAGPMDLGLHERMFETGTVIKLYSYDLPSGSRSVISRDLNQSINEYLFSPALPIYTIDREERYPDDRNLQRELYGLKRRLEEDGSKYVSEFFSEELTEKEAGRIKVTCYVFNTRVEGKRAKESKASIQREFFKNNMAVLFSVHGQVHGHYTSEFITRALKFPLLKDYLLIHVDCTELMLEVRNELFMASRDRLKAGEESRELRRTLAKVLSQGRLRDIYKERKSAISVEGKDADDLLRDFTRNLPLNSDLVKLLGETFKLEDRKKRGDETKVERQKNRSRKKKEAAPFKPQRFPSFFKINRNGRDETPVVKVPIGGERTVSFSTDVEDSYFDRVNDPGDMTITVLDVAQNEATGGTRAGLPRKAGELLNVVRSSPHNGTIRVVMNPTAEVQVGDSMTVRAELAAPEGAFEEVFVVRITDPEVRGNTKDKGKDEVDEPLGLPGLVLIYQSGEDGRVTWDALEQQGVDVDHQTIMHPLVEGDILSRIYVNMESSVFLNYRSKLSSEDALTLAERRYLSAVYFHTVFLYMITRNRKYEIVRRLDGSESEESIDLTEYLKDVFQSYYADFLLNFEISDLVTALDE